MPNSTESRRTTTLKGNPFALAGPQLRPGDEAPDFTVVDSTLQEINLQKTGHGVRIFSVLPSLDTPVCDAQTRRFDTEAEKLSDVSIFTISMDLPFAQKRWCGNYGVNRIAMLSDHRSGSFGEHYGTLIPDLRIECRAIFVVDTDNKLRHVEYVKEVGDHPNYEAALAAAKAAVEQTAVSKP
ncbi:MAG TPA: thiol peroxidase [Bryobacteraceae bacterium]|jgi:thiol peroxidase|nr:thiol peroxidase [Bryobacteraceae bacterium]